MWSMRPGRSPPVPFIAHLVFVLLTFSEMSCSQKTETAHGKQKHVLSDWKVRQVCSGGSEGSTGGYSASQDHGPPLTLGKRRWQRGSDCGMPPVSLSHRPRAHMPVLLSSLHPLPVSQGHLRANRIEVSLDEPVSEERKQTRC